MIPKIIHYCWFGGKPLPELALKCVASWKKFFPDYEIKEWNEANYDINCCDYVREAYAAKKWAFVSDYVRFDVLYKYGGIYFDVDVEVIKSFDDIIERGAFMGCEGATMGANLIDIIKGTSHTHKIVSVASGLGMGVNPGHELYKTILDTYHSSHFVNSKYKLYHVVRRVTDLLKTKGFNELLDDKVQNICGVRIYPPEYFSPIDLGTRKLEITENTRTIHHYAASWVSASVRLPWKITCFFVRIFGNRFGYHVGWIVSLPMRVYVKACRDGIKETLKTIYYRLGGG